MVERYTVEQEVGGSISVLGIFLEQQRYRISCTNFWKISSPTPTEEHRTFERW